MVVLLHNSDVTYNTTDTSDRALEELLVEHDERSDD